MQQTAMTQADAGRGANDLNNRTTDPHRWLTATVRVTGTEKVPDLQAEAVRVAR